MNPSRRFTLVSFHAHPDDEALLTGGTLARAAAEGHRVVIVVATAGEAGLADQPPDPALGARRRVELAASARALGVARVEILGYRDSGYPTRAQATEVSSPGAGGPVPFCDLDPKLPAEALARILERERADALTTYDGAGGYGHPDHVQVHRVGALAAELASTPLVLEATVDRGLLLAVVRLLRWLSRVLPLPDLPDLDAAYTDSSLLTHRVDVGDFLGQKRCSMIAHASQSTGGVRTMAVLLRLPRPLARRVLGREWFREPGRTPGAPLLDDIFATLRDR